MSQGFKIFKLKKTTQSRKDSNFKNLHNVTKNRALPTCENMIISMNF